MYVAAARVIQNPTYNIALSRVALSASRVEAFLLRGLRGQEWVREGAMGVL